MNDFRWFNPHQPQTLQIGVLLLYLDAVLGLFFGVVAESALLGLFIIVAMGAGAIGIANEKKWGYGLGVAGAVAQLVALLAFFGPAGALNEAPLPLIFDAALVALLLHPMSRDYQRIWFR